MYQNFITPYLYEAQHVLGETPPHQKKQKNCTGSLWFFVRGRSLAVGGHCQALPDNVHQPHSQQPFMHKKPEAASAVLGS
jgi:hypothetical protein